MRRDPNFFLIFLHDYWIGVKSLHQESGKSPKLRFRGLFVVKGSVLTLAVYKMVDMAGVGDCGGSSRAGRLLFQCLHVLLVEVRDAYDGNNLYVDMSVTGWVRGVEGGGGGWGWGCGGWWRGVAVVGWW